MKNPKFARMIRGINWYVPFVGMGIRVRAYNARPGLISSMVQTS